MKPEELGKSKERRYRRWTNMELDRPGADDYTDRRDWGIEWDTPRYLYNTVKNKVRKQDLEAYKREGDSIKKAQIEAFKAGFGENR